MSEYLVIPLVGYFLGSFPTAYLVVRWKIHQDIRLLGSGNVGALNCYQVTGSRILGVAVFIVDVAKGIVALLIVESLFPGDFWNLGLCGLAVVGGHNFPVWLRFQGGRGLATSMGVILLLGWPLVLLWIGSWLIAYWRTRDILLGNGWATLITPIVLVVTPNSVVAVASTASVPAEDFLILVALLSGVVLTKHVGPIIAIFKERRNHRVKASS